MSRAVFHSGPAGIASGESHADVLVGGGRAVAPEAHDIRAADAFGTGPRTAG
jgi:hypothetical protein